MTDGAALSQGGTQLGAQPRRQPQPHRLQEQTPLQVRQWRDLARLFTTTSCQLDKALHDQHGIGMSEFEILDRLAEADDCAARMQELADEVHLSQSALSRAVDRLEREGLVARASCSTDRRGVFVNITEDGRNRWRDACPTQRAVLAATLSSEAGAETEPAATAATA